jgi:phosphatidylglycerol---prolipoprotein diacylglyceryl transferase
MTFPVVWTIGPVSIQAHVLFEALAYVVGFRIYLALRRRSADPIPTATRWTVIAAAIVGAALGSKLLHWLEDPAITWAHRGDLAFLAGGKSIVGGLLGGLAAVEIVKRRIGETRSTGDLFVLPLCAGMAIGRVGCLLAGPADHTIGGPTSLPWGVDFGDGVARHPLPAYEIVALAAIAAWSVARERERGDAFKGFLALYLAFRFAVDFLKPEPRFYLGLSGIQVACVGGLLAWARHWPRVFLSRRAEALAHG